jgi:hypothetical protein
MEPDPKNPLHAKVNVDQFCFFIKIEGKEPSNVKSPHVEKVSKIFRKEFN